jgi:pimeloyl-ACP methyl ester carboxylesterase
MVASLPGWFDRFETYPYKRRPPLVLLNGLAEQAETWFRNHPYWRRHFDVHMPNLVVYEGPALHERIAQDLPVSVDYLVEQLREYLHAFVQAPPYHLVASSLGGKIAVEFAARYPKEVARMVLLCPSGLGDQEQLPIIEGVRRSDVRSLIDSVFCDAGRVDPRLVEYYRRQFGNRRWRVGLLRTIRGTMDYCVRDRLGQVAAPTLLVSGREDRIVDCKTAAVAARELPHGQFLVLPDCGHAPQMERPSLINRLVVHFLTQPAPADGALTLLLSHSGA